MSNDDVEYEFKDVRAIRGTEARSVSKWQKEGWELVGQQQGAVRTELNFRRVKPRTVGDHLRRFVAQVYGAFRRQTPHVQRRILAGLSVLVGVLVLAGVAYGVWYSGESSEVARPQSAPVESQSHQPTEEPAPESSPDAYKGPRYEIVSVDVKQGPSELDQFWVHAEKFEYGNEEYKEQVKLILADVARSEGTDKLMVEVVSDKEIALAESPSTYQDFLREFGSDYAINTIPQKEKAGWVASYAGGRDPDSGQASDSAEAFEIVWRPYATSEIEKWRPDLEESS